MSEVKLTLENIDVELKASQGVFQLLVLDLLSKKADLEKQIFAAQTEMDRINNIQLIEAARKSITTTPKAKEAIGRIQCWLDQARSVTKKIDAGGVDSRYDVIFDQLIEMEFLIGE